MQLEFEGETFWHNGEPCDRSHASVANSAFNQCFVRRRERGWNRFSDIKLRNVSHWNCSLSGSSLERIELHNLKRIGSSPLFLDGCIFKEVRLIGRIAGLKINTFSSNELANDDAAELLRECYQNVDWAIDISKAQFPGGITFEALPGDKIIRDPERHVLLRRENLERYDWRGLDYESSAIDIAISWFHELSPFDSVVVTARDSPKYFEQDMQVLQMLRDIGLADPD